MLVREEGSPGFPAPEPPFSLLSVPSAGSEATSFPDIVLSANEGAQDRVSKNGTVLGNPGHMVTLVAAHDAWDLFVLVSL